MSCLVDPLLVGVHEERCSDCRTSQDSHTGVEGSDVVCSKEGGTDDQTEDGELNSVPGDLRIIDGSEIPVNYLLEPCFILFNLKNILLTRSCWSERTRLWINNLHFEVVCCQVIVVHCLGS